MSRLSLALLVSLVACEMGSKPDDSGLDTGTDTSDDSSGDDTADSGPSGDGFAFGEIVGHIDIDYAEDLAMHGDTAYVTSKTNGLQIIDVSDPTAPALVGTIASGDQAWDLVVDGENDMLYLADYAGGLRAFAIDDPHAPTETASYVPGWTVIGVSLHAGRIVATGGDGTNGRMAVLDAEDLAELGTYDAITGTNSAGTSVAHRGDTAWYGQAEGTLHVLDISDPSAIAPVTTYKHPGTAGHEPWCLGLFVDDSTDRLYLSDWGAGVVTLDISNPENPVELSAFAEGGYAFYDTWAKGDRAYIALDGGLGVLDMSDPASPSLVGGSYISAKLELDDGLHGVHVQNGLAFLADNKEQTLTIIGTTE